MVCRGLRRLQRFLYISKTEECNLTHGLHAVIGHVSRGERVFLFSFFTEPFLSLFVCTTKWNTTNASGGIFCNLTCFCDPLYKLLRFKNTKPIKLNVWVVVNEKTKSSSEKQTVWTSPVPWQLSKHNLLMRTLHYSQKLVICNFPTVIATNFDHN